MDFFRPTHPLNLENSRFFFFEPFPKESKIPNKTMNVLLQFNCWTLTDYSKCVFLDADTLVIQNSDELFDREEFSAAPDAGWPDCFNSGVFVFTPSLETFKKLIQHAITQGSFDGGDQGLLNTFFSDWATKVSLLNILSLA